MAAGVAPAALLIQNRFPATASAEPQSAANGATSYVPVPERARGPQIPSKGYLLDHIGDGLYGVRDGIYQSMFLVTRTGVVVVDAPASLGEKLLAAIGEVTRRPVTHVVYSHSHLDHIGAAHLFPRNARYVAHELTAQLLKRADDDRRPLPTRTFAGHRQVLEVGGKRLILEYRGNNHQAGNLFIYAPDQQVLMLVDILEPRWTPFFRLGLSPNLRVYSDATEQILDYEFRTFVSGHTGNFGTRADVEEHGRYLGDLQSATSEAYRTIDFADAVKDVPPDNVYAQFKVYTDKLVDRSVELMPRSWLTRIGGADVFLRDNASALVFGLLID